MAKIYLTNVLEDVSFCTKTVFILLDDPHSIFWVYFASTDLINENLSNSFNGMCEKYAGT